MSMTWYNDNTTGNLRATVLLRGVRGGIRVLLACAPATICTTQTSTTFEWPMVAKWTELQEAVVGGHDVEAWLVVTSNDPVSMEHTLFIPSSSGSFSARSMLDGPFADVTLRAGGREFQAHRVVVAAASEVFMQMLGGSMREGQTAVVELRDTDADAVQLLLEHMYGANIHVPLSLAVALHSLADQYQLCSDLAWRLVVELSSLRLQPAALWQILPAASCTCGDACHGSLYQQAADQARDMMSIQHEDLRAWPLDCVLGVVRAARLPCGFHAAMAWLSAWEQQGVDENMQQAQQGTPYMPVDQPHVAVAENSTAWRSLVEAMAWERATRADIELLEDMLQVNPAVLWPLRQYVQEHVIAAYDRLLMRSEEQALWQQDKIKEQEARIAYLEQRVQEWQARGVQLL